MQSLAQHGLTIIDAKNEIIKQLIKNNILLTYFTAKSNIYKLYLIDQVFFSLLV